MKYVDYIDLQTVPKAFDCNEWSGISTNFECTGMFRLEVDTHALEIEVIIPLTKNIKYGFFAKEKVNKYKITVWVPESCFGTYKEKEWEIFECQKQ